MRGTLERPNGLDREAVIRRIGELQSELNELMDNQKPSRPGGDFHDDIRRINKEINNLQGQL